MTISHPNHAPPALSDLGTAADLVDAPLAATTADLTYLWTNAAFAALVGLPQDAIVGRRVGEVLGAEAEVAFESAGLASGPGRIELEVELQPRSMPAVTTPLRVVLTRATDAGDGAPVWVHTVHDVSGHRRGIESASQLAAIVECSDDAIIGKTLDGIVTSWNEGARRLFGYEPEEMIGQPIQRIMPADRVDDMQRILGRIRLGERVHHFETERVRKDGTRLQVSLTVSPIKDASGRVIGASKIARDVTERRRAEDALRETLELLATLNRTSVLLSAELDLAKLVQAVTDAATEGTGARYGAFFYNTSDGDGDHYQLYALSGASTGDFLDFPNPRATEIFAPTFRGERVIRIDDVRRDPRYGRSAPYHGMPPGHPQVVSYLAAPVVLRGEVLGGLFFGHPDPAVFSERDERLVAGLAAQAAIAIDNARLYDAERRARGEAEAASRAKDELLSVVSHELRTPLTSMLGWVAVLRQGRLGPDGVARALDTIERSGRVQQELIDDLLDVSRIVAGTLKLDLQPVDLRTIADVAIDLVRPDALAKRVHIEATLAEHAVVIGDPIRLQQVVSNVLANAVKYTPSERAIHVALGHEDGIATLVVRDEGIGIDADFLPFVFEPFRQAENVRKRKGGGLGLGLAIARNLIEQQGGALAAESEGRDRGATFTVTLPLATEAAIAEHARGEQEGIM